MRIRIARQRATAKSVDYAVLEKTTRAAVVPVSYGWADVGAWQAGWDMAEKDAAEDRKPDVQVPDVEDDVSYIRAPLRVVNSPDLRGGRAEMPHLAG